MPLLSFPQGNIFHEHVQQFPDRPTLVFLHDSLGCTELWRDFPAFIAEKTQCNLLIYDRLGYGKSSPFVTEKRENNYMELEADFLNELLEKLKIDNCILFGHSDGGTISLIAGAVENQSHFYGRSTYFCGRNYFGRNSTSERNVSHN